MQQGIPKITLEGTSIQVFNESASGTVTYAFDDTLTQGTGEDLQTPYQTNPSLGGGSALQLLIGLNHFRAFTGYYNNYIWGWVGSTDVQRHQLRVSNMHISALGKNPYMYKIEIDLASRPKPTYESGCSGNQETVSSYIIPTQKQGNADPNAVNLGISELNPQRIQMTLDYFLQQGEILLDDGSGNPAPMSDTIFPILPVSASTLTFGASFRFSATYYADEISPIALSPGMPSMQVRALMNKLCAYYHNTVNNKSLFFLGDAGYWCITNINAMSPDGGYSYRFTGEWTFNRNGWDTTSVYSDPVTGQNAIISDQAYQEIQAPCLVSDTSQAIPDPYIPYNVFNQEISAGVGRFPQTRQLNHGPLLKCLLQEGQVVQNDNMYKDAMGNIIQDVSVKSLLDALYPLGNLD